MDNPWKYIALEDYEKHMKLDSVQQLQTLNTIMKEQLSRYDIDTAMVLGVAGGNGLEHVDPEKYKIIYGVDINKDYLHQCKLRYPSLKNVFVPVLVDVQKEENLPSAKLIIANLFIEYVGYETFMQVVKQAKPCYVSCVIQINEEDGFISDSPYIHVFDRLEEVHHQMEYEVLNSKMKEIGWNNIDCKEYALPNGKKLVRLDYKLPCQIRFYESLEDRKISFVVVIASYNGKWILCRHKNRATWECPGGHREKGENLEETARRELYEETGATECRLHSIGAYSVEGFDEVYENSKESFGMLFYAEVTKIEELPKESEMKEMIYSSELPKHWTYPEIQPLLFKRLEQYSDSLM